MMSDDVRRLLVLCAARVDGRSMDWSLLARCATQGGLDELYAGVMPETGAAATRSVPLLHAALRDLSDAEARVDEELAAGRQAGARLVSVLDPDYPPNLRAVPDLPPFLFICGELTTADARAVAVVGTRAVSDTGRLRAARMARELVEHGVTVVSGLAKGVDTAAHTATLQAGGRTIAVIGTGVTRCYPAENRDLADRITRHGAVASQFWPTRSPGRDTFPRRNRVTSGLSQGTVVIEASSTSGAKMQARLASEHGKHVWLLHSLVMEQPWARKMVDAGTAKEISSTGDVLADLVDPEPPADRRLDSAQLTLDLP